MSKLVFQTNKGKLIVDIGDYDRPTINKMYQAVYTCNGIVFKKTWYAEHKGYNRTIYEDPYDIARYAFEECIDPEYSTSKEIVREYLKHGIVIGKPLYDEWMIEKYSSLGRVSRRWHELTQKEKDDFSTYRPHYISYTPLEQELIKELSAPIYDKWVNDYGELIKDIKYLDRIIVNYSSRERIYQNIEKEKAAANKEGRPTVWETYKLQGAYCPDPCPAKMEEEIEYNNIFVENALKEVRKWRKEHEYLEPNSKPRPTPKESATQNKKPKTQSDIEKIANSVFDFFWG